MGVYTLLFLLIQFRHPILIRITPGHCANISEKDTLFKDREPPRTIPYSAARPYIAHIGECPPPSGFGDSALDCESKLMLAQAGKRVHITCIYQAKRKVILIVVN